jgi:hypothetical protein
MGSQAILMDVLYNKPMMGKLTIRSMAQQKLPEDFGAHLAVGKHLYPDATFFMMKMFERCDYIHYDPMLGRYVDGVLRLEDIKKVEMFKNIDDPAYVNPDLGELLRRRGSRLETPLRRLAPWLAPQRSAASERRAA